MALTISIVTPETTLLTEKTDSVVVTLTDGETGILPMHARMIGRLGYGELRFGSAGPDQRFYVDGGFVQVANDEVNVLTSRAVKVSEINRADAEQQLREAESMAPENPEQLAAKNKALEQARALVRLASS